TNMRVAPALLGLIGLALTALGGPAHAQDYPSRPVTFVLITAAAGPLSILMRMISEPLGKRWKQPVIVENRPGAGGLIASDYVKRANPDGYTLLFGGDAMTTFRIFMKTDFDIERDLEPLTIAIYSSSLLQVNSLVPAKTLKDFIAYAKANPG